MRIRRLTTLLLAIFAILTILPQLAVQTDAAYENTYKNTGDQRADIVGVALTQVGYREGDGKSNNNQNKYSEYFGYGARAWCGDFVSWCARQAGIPKSVLKNSGPAKPSTFGITTVMDGADGYTPRPGDLFFKKDGSHVGIVYYTSGSYFYTLEGNTWSGSPRKDGVYSRKRKISDFNFGVPNYTSDSGSSTCDHSYTTKNESSHPHKEYKICSKCSYKTYTGKNGTVDDCKSCIQEACSHTYGEWVKSSSSKHKRTCSKCGKEESGSHKWGTATVETEATCNKKGTKVQLCTSCNAEKKTDIPATGKHTYDDVQYIDDTYHGKTCTGCGKTEKVKHSVEEDWTYDGKNHWRFCSECSNKYDLGEHDYLEGCGSACKSCGYISPFKHEITDELAFDAELHWNQCSLCSYAISPEPHTFTSDCDETCDICGVLRETKTEHTNVMCSDETEHWLGCSVCGHQQAHTPHDPDLSAKDWEDQICLTCSYMIRSADEHVHTYDSIEYDRRTHWGTCACGTQIPAEGHRFSMETGICSICGAESSPLGAQQDYDWVWMAAIGFCGTTMAGMSLVLIFRRLFRKRV